MRPLGEFLLPPGEAGDLSALHQGLAVAQCDVEQAARPVADGRDDPAGLVEPCDERLQRLALVIVEHHTVTAGDVDLGHGHGFLELVHEQAVGIPLVGAEVAEDGVRETLRVQWHESALDAGDGDCESGLFCDVVEVCQFTQPETGAVSDLLVLACGSCGAWDSFRRAWFDSEGGVSIESTRERSVPSGRRCTGEDCHPAGVE
ncbi:hypothetical protein ACM01_07920 [Streptomyces viridochromogenes]|uniref:Uncharacterized protein n=1 Tax=Streptomyces viridochromogenes TaxID=1938 RepID=A0A0J7ZJU3_STRVR|nr:hypothetical protein ACM01_07920 [Streptomyces viridochromogenes]KOG07034.1 hypothetical protein ADK35_44600 [Streptomyces viridochromogenes]KOG16898.1 hypothetical protein ADK36_25455 [Streptomyces viridochromogenes]